MSSNHRPQPLPAVVLERGVPVGGISLPSENAEAFLAEFNRQYGPVGLSLYRIAAMEVSKAVNDQGTLGIEDQPVVNRDR